VQDLSVSVSHFYHGFWCRPDKREAMNLPEMVRNPKYKELTKRMVRWNLDNNAALVIQRFYRDQKLCRETRRGMAGCRQGRLRRERSGIKEELLDSMQQLQGLKVAVDKLPGNAGGS